MLEIKSSLSLEEPQNARNIFKEEKLQKTFLQILNSIKTNSPLQSTNL